MDVKDNIFVIGLTLGLAGGAKANNVNSEKTDLSSYVEETKELPRTCALNEFQYTEYFEELRKTYDAVIHISLSSKITSSVEHAVDASQKVENVTVIDSRSLSTGIALLCIYARELADKGESVEDIVTKVKKRRDNLQVSFVVNTLSYLHKGGRCSSLARISAALLRIKPQILLKKGEMVTGKKYFGKNRSVIESYCSDVIEEFDNPDLNIAFVTHTHASPDMVEVAKMALKERGFKNIVETLAGAIQSALDYNVYFSNGIAFESYAVSRSRIDEKDKNIMRIRLTFDIRAYETIETNGGQG